MTESRYCCRHQVVHDDELCCEHGIVHRGDALHHDDGSHRWTSSSTRGALVARHELAIARHVADGHTHDEPGLVDDVAGPVEALAGEHGIGEALLVVLVTSAMAAVLVASAWIGYHGSDTVKLLGAVALLVLSSPALVVAVRYDPEIHESPTAALRHAPNGVENPTANVEVDTELLVVGTVRRRFFRAGGSTQSRTEVVADKVVIIGDDKRSQRVAMRAVDTYALQRIAEGVADIDMSALEEAIES